MEISSAVQASLPHLSSSLTVTVVSPVGTRTRVGTRCHKLEPDDMNEDQTLEPNDMDEDQTLDGVFPATKESMAKKVMKIYNPKWERDPLLKTWIERDPMDKGKVVCRFCDSKIRAHKNDLMEHTMTLKHQRNFMQNTNSEVYNQFVVRLNEFRKDHNLRLYRHRRKMEVAPKVEVTPKNATTIKTSAVKRSKNSNELLISKNDSLADIFECEDENNGNEELLITKNDSLAEIFECEDENNGDEELLISKNDSLAEIFEREDENNGDEELWQDGNRGKSAEYPSDLFSVSFVDEDEQEQKWPTLNSLEVSVSTASCSKNTPYSLSIAKTQSRNHSSLGNRSVNCVTQAKVPSSSLQPNEILQSVDRGLNFAATDVVKAILAGRFSIGEVCTIAKAATTQIEQSFLVATNSNSVAGSTNQNPAPIRGCYSTLGSGMSSNKISRSVPSSAVPKTKTSEQNLVVGVHGTQYASKVKKHSVPGRNTQKRKAVKTNS